MAVTITATEAVRIYLTDGPLAERVRRDVEKFDGRDGLAEWLRDLVHALLVRDLAEDPRLQNGLDRVDWDDLAEMLRGADA